MANEWQTKLNLPVGKHTFIAAYGGVNRAAEPGLATGPLTTGYGARPTAFGPEYAFGIMLKKHLDQPVLIIKTAWGGKSLHYDFRPPSAGSYQPTAGEMAQVENWKVKKAAWDKYIAGGGTATAMAQIDKDFKAIDTQKRTLQASIAKLPKAQREAAKVPELAGTVAAVENWPLTTPEVAIWRTSPQWTLYGSNQGYHYDGSGRFFIRLGDEFANAMLKLMGKK